MRIHLETDRKGSSIALLILALCLAVVDAEGETVNRPNVLWIVFEDISPNLGCYGDDYAVTPNLDRFAEIASRFTRVWSNGCACSPARSTLITGMYATSLGTENQRSREILPSFVGTFTEHLREAGYYCSNHSKQDYNFIPRDTAWDANDENWRENGWSRRKPGQPFFTVVNFTDTHSSQIYWRGEERWRKRREALDPHERRDPAEADVPPYYPDTPEVRQDLSRYYDNVTYADRLFQQVLDKLDADGMSDETIVFFFSDHGRGMPRGKSWCFDSSLHVPLLIHFPKAYEHLAPGPAGETIDTLVGFVDFAPTILALAGVEIPEHFQGRPFLGAEELQAKEYLYGFRGRMDDRYDLIRSVTDGRFQYIRNFMPHLPWFRKQTREYPKLQPSYQVWNGMAAAGELEGSAAIFMAESKSREELYDLAADPYQVNNLAESPDYQTVLNRMREALKNKMIETKDLGLMPEFQRDLRFGDRNKSFSLYEAVRRSQESYPIERVFQTADLVGAGEDVIEKQIQELSDHDPAIRFWSAIGLLAQGEAASQARNDLTRALQDTDPVVRIVAAHALAETGDTEASFRVLLDHLKHRHPYISLRAANALDHLGLRIEPIIEEVLAPLEQNPDPSIYNSHYPQRILRTIAERFESKGR